MRIGNVTIGGQNGIAVQSMTNTVTSDAEATVKQIKALEKAGCDIVRCAVPDSASAKAIYEIKKRISIPLVADIHFDYRLALEALEAGADKIRINPGNIGGENRVRAVASACANKGVPIRIGVNGGSLEKGLLAKFGGVTPEALAESARVHIMLLNKFDFDNICVAIKSSDVSDTVAACRIMAQESGYPLHLGVTEAGTPRLGILKSAIGIGSLLCDGIGDTIRVSLTSDPVDEIYAARDILKAAGLGGGVNVISCPTCARTRIDLIEIASRLEGLVENCPKNITVALMGCAVNGPGEAREADIGVAGGDGCAVLFKKGEIIGKIAQNDIIPTLMSEIERL